MTNGKITLHGERDYRQHRAVGRPGQTIGWEVRSVNSWLTGTL